MSDCTDSIDDVKRVKHILNDDKPLNSQGLTILSPADQQTGVCLSLVPPELLQYSCCGSFITRFFFHQE